MTKHSDKSDGTVANPSTERTTTQPTDRRQMAELFPSVVMSVSNAAHFFDDYINRLSDVMEANFEQYEIIIVDSGSSDETVEIVSKAQKRRSGIILLKLLRNSDSDVALIAGLDHAIGDVAIMLDPKLDQPEILPMVVQKALEGYDVVYALPRERIDGIGLANKLANRFFGFIERAKNINLPKEISSVRLVSRAVLNFMLNSSDLHRTLIVAPALSGYQHATVDYDREYPGDLHAGDSHPGNRGIRHRGEGLRTLRRAINIIFTISVKPLRVVSILALSVSALTFFYSIYIIITWIMLETIAPGWVSISLQISGLFFLTSIVLAVMSEYLLQVLENTGRRPLYYLSGQTQSDSLSYDERLNVLKVDDDIGALSPIDSKAKKGKQVSRKRSRAKAAKGQKRSRTVSNAS